MEQGQRSLPSSRLTGRLVLLVTAMRAAGARVGLGQLLSAHRALLAVDASDRGECFFALRAVLCARREDLATFEAAFGEVFGDGGAASQRQPEVLDDVARLVLPRVAVPAGDRAGVRDLEESEVVPAAWSDVELLRDKDFAEYTEAERVIARRVLAHLAARGPMRPSRRLRAS
ncbi:MAG TPA: hypothetical protein VEQ61_04130, partial [Thermoleophilaceae bacterium]|nr:hypothetical protein [Thermoleophilaceae bacterium]